MAQYGGNKGGGGGAQQQPWSRPGNAAPGGVPGMEMPPGLMGFGNAAAAAAASQAAAGAAAAFQQAGIPPPGLAALGPGGHNPAVTMAAMSGMGQQGAVSYPRPLGAPPHFATTPAQQILQQQQQAAAAVVGVSLQHQQQAHHQPHPQHGPPGPGQSSQRVFTGTVTKLHDNFGFVDEDVFFQTSVVKGQVPRVNDRVLVEAGYNPNMPFKWNATRIQVLPNQRGGGNQPPPTAATTGHVNPTATPNTLAFSNASGPPNLSAPSPPAIQGAKLLQARGGGGDNSYRISDPGGARLGGANRQNHSPMRTSSGRMDGKSDGGGSGGGSSSRPSDRADRRQRDRDRERSRDKDRGRSSPPASSSVAAGGSGPSSGGGGASSTSTSSRKRSRSPRSTRTRSRSRSRSPPRRRARTTPRYNVSVPKYFLHFPGSNVLELRRRYSSMYVPSDFFSASHVWSRAFPVHRPLRLQHPAAFHIFNRELVEAPTHGPEAVYDPPDADYTYCVKVMLLACPPVEDLYEKTCHLAEKGSHDRDKLVHPTRAIQFLVGVRGKNETLAIGGPWSPSLDGPNPDKDPSVLMRTAIRTCKALTGIDLSGCTQWHKFLEIYYRRQETSSKPARTETTVLFLPDVWSLMPNAEEFSKLEESYAEALNIRLDPELASKKAEEQAAAAAAAAAVAATETATATDNVAEKMDTEDGDNAPTVEEEDEEVSGGAGEEDKGSEECDAKKSPTHWKELDVKTMKVNELREELEARGLQAKGLKSQLVGRLQKSIKEEQDKEEKEEQEKAAAAAAAAAAKAKEEEEEKASKAKAIVKTQQEDEDNDVIAIDVVNKSKDEFAKPLTIDEKRKKNLTEAYKFPSSPCILVHPNPKAKSGKFDCATMSLSLLLDYRSDDNKEGTFEVSLFAELFNEMLMRDAGFKLYRSLVVKGAPPKESKKDDKAKEDEKKDDSSVDDDSSKKDDDKKKEEKKKHLMVTKDKELLMACSYFDLSHCGYFETKDLEDILFTLNLSLSRAQTKKLVARAATSKDHVNYRVYTDRPAEDVGEDNVEDEEIAKIEEEVEIEKLGLGFRAFLPNAEVSKEFSEEASTSPDGMCIIDGSVVDVKKLMAQLRRSESARVEVNGRLSETVKALTDAKEGLERQIANKEKLQLEVRDLKKRLRTSDDEHKQALSDSKKYFSTLKDVYERVCPHLEEAEEKEEKEASEAAVEEKKKDSAAASLNGQAPSEVKAEVSKN